LSFVTEKKRHLFLFYSFLFFVFEIVISPRLARSLSEKGYSILPRDTMNYLTSLINQILSRRREHLERRNDFIQIMVDHEEDVKHVDKQDQQWGTLKKSQIILFKKL